MGESNPTPDVSADAQERAGATEDGGGVPISEQELAQVWTGSAAEHPAGAAEKMKNESGTVESVDPGEAGDIKPEVPDDDPEPAEPS